MDFKVYDNFLDKDIFDELSTVISGWNFPWYYNDTIVHEHDKTLIQDGVDLSIYNYQFAHDFYSNYKPQSDFWYLMEPIIDKIGVQSLLRIKANLGLSTPIRIASGLHHDFDLDYANAKTGILYINTNNGATRFEDGSEVQSLANRFVFFDNSVAHTGVSCTDQKNRIVINFCYYGNKEIK